MSELILALLTWIAAESGLARPPPPAVVLMPKEQMAEVVYGRSWYAADDLRAFYSRKTGIVYLRDDWSYRDLRSQATLLHELVHHAQDFNRTAADCAAGRESQAYDLTLEWLRDQGVEDPHGILGMDAFSIYVMSTCRD